MGISVTELGAVTAAGRILVAAWLSLVIAWPGSQAPGGPDRKAPHAGHPLTQAQTTADQPVVYLTFDDGPHPVYTPKVLDLLAEYNVKATFFVVGSMVERFPDVTRRIATEGHSIQLHTWRHDDLTKLTREEFMADNFRVQAILGKTVQRRGTCIRPPYGSINAEVRGWAEELYLTVAMWDVSGQDWTDISAARIARLVIGGTGPESVVLLHDGGGHRQPTVSALETILAQLTEEGYRFDVLCASLPLPDPSPPCWIAYAWPVLGPCEDSALPTAR